MRGCVRRVMAAVLAGVAVCVLAACSNSGAGNKPITVKDPLGGDTGTTVVVGAGYPGPVP